MSCFKTVIARKIVLPSVLYILLAALNAGAGQPLRIVYNTGVAPLKFVDESGNPAGLLPDIWRLWAEKTGTKIQFIKAKTFDDSLNLLKNGGSDLHAGIFKTKKREEFLSYSEPFLNLDYYLFSHPAIRPVSSVENTSGYIIGIQKGGFTENWVYSKKAARHIALYDSFKELFTAAQKGEIKVFVATDLSLFYYLSQTRLANIFAFDKTAPLYSQVYYTATAKKNHSLIQSVNKGLSAITGKEWEQLRTKWIISKSRKIPVDFASVLTGEELSFLSKTESIKVHNETDWAPFNFNENGIPKGFSIDYISLLAEKTGLEIKFVNYPSWHEFLSMIKSGDLDVMLNIAKSPEREKFMEYTPPYLKMSIKIFTRDNSPAVRSIRDLFGKKIAVLKGFYIQEILGQYPQIELLLVEDSTSAIRKVSSGKADAVFGLKPVISYLAGQLQITNLKADDIIIPGTSDISMHMAVSKKQSVLAGILEKGMPRISDEEILALEKKWLGKRKIPHPEISLTPEEQNWLKAHPVIRVANEPDYAPFDFIENGRPAGFSIDYLNILAEKAGIHFEFVQDTWGNLVEKGKKKELDLLHTLFKTPERTQYFLFSTPYKTVTNVIYVREGVEGVAGISDLSGKKIILPRGDSVSDSLPKLVTNADYIFYDTYADILKALSMGKGDATVMDSAVVNYLVRKNTLTNIQAVAEADIPYETRGSVYRVAVRNDWPILLNILQKAMNALTPDELNSLHMKWFGRTGKTGQTYPELALTAKEQKFVTFHKPLIFSEVNWKPLSFADNPQRYDGMIADYLRIVSERSDLKFVFQKTETDTWTEVLQKYTDRKIDVVPALGKDDKIGREILLSDPFVTFPLVIVTRDDISYIKDTRELNKTKVAVGRGYTSFHFLNNNYPEIDLIETDNVEQALMKLSNGQVFAFVGHMAVAVDSIQKLGMKNLKIAGETEFYFDHRIGVDPKYPEAVSIINKALASITEQEHRAIYKKWLDVDYHKHIDYTLLWKTIGGAVIFFSVILFWNFKLAKLNRDLNTEIVERRKAEKIIVKSEKELLKAKENAEAASRSKSMFLANMSHEIRTPMNSALGFLSLALEDTDISEKQRKYLTTSYNSSKMLLNIINDILDISKLESGRLELENMPFNLHTIIKETIILLDISAKNKGLSLELNIHDAVPQYVAGDSGRLKQILINLVGNAVKFTEKGGVKIRISPRNEEKNIIRFAISDTGIGIPEDRLQSIFDPFTQADATMTRRFGGTGLGTTISRQLAELMGGEIWVKSEAGKGSTFYFTVNTIPTDSTSLDYHSIGEYSSSDKRNDPPLNESDNPSLSESGDVFPDNCLLSKSDNLSLDNSLFSESDNLSSLGESDNSRCFRALIAEDIEENIILARIRLEYQGHTVFEARNGYEALKLFEQEAIDIVLMDVYMPEMDGLEASLQIRRLEEGTGNRVPIIALTASVMKEDQQICLDSGIDIVVGKPVDFDELFEIMEKLIPQNVGRPKADQRARIKSDQNLADIYSKLLELKGIDTKKGIQIWKDVNAYQTALIGFSCKYENAAEEIISLIRKNDWKGASHIIHTLKGVAGNLSITEVYKIAVNLNIIIREKQADKLILLSESLATALNSVIASVQQLEPGKENLETSGVASDLPLLEELIRKMLASFEEYNPLAVGPFLEQLDRFLSPEQLAPIKQQVDKFDFDGARDETLKLASGLGIKYED
ncbi:MAG: transporter substrate-binding domain-containing protein [Desulfobacterales bacterium]|nr:transporter substrate-binding domain-containing protein [Desulfobacterales bacterium]